ncbi:intein C-terminal splicing region/intein N-terminal splicing region [Kibdelosporangium aridum]|uniref:Intein C-terminal splicing region/intein N-terminal splicing region n=2 Tax=Kibdelosporangium aridum TaxID=2030 RepID=A0A1Y5XMN8_KIBAR|nr:intein C-terminal splicing region/intein N-terminal splicing region [Kibdelosporangium aridum]
MQVPPFAAFRAQAIGPIEPTGPKPIFDLSQRPITVYLHHSERADIAMARRLAHTLNTYFVFEGSGIWGLYVMARIRAALSAFITTALVAGLVTEVPVAAAAPDDPVSERRQVVNLLKTGGPDTVKSAQTALLGSDNDVRQFLQTGRQLASERDLRVQVTLVLSAGGRVVRQAAQNALNGTAADLRAFLDTGWKQPWEEDLRIQVTQAMAAGGPKVKAAAQRALDGTPDDLLVFLQSEQQKAQDDDDTIRTVQLLSAGGPEVRKAAQRALDGTIEDVREFLRLGYQAAAARDQEVISVSQLADLARSATARAVAETQSAKEASDRAVHAARLAKEAAAKAADETRAAKDSAIRAAEAAGRAADAAKRAAQAAQTALSAAAVANEAARIAANAASQAATAAALAGEAASRANKAAQAAHAEKAKAGQAEQAAKDARAVAEGAKMAAQAAQAAGQAAQAAGAAAVAAARAGQEALAASNAAKQAGGYAKEAGAKAEEAERAAANAKRAADEATRAANVVQAIANEAAAAAFEARDAANQAAIHAENAATQADYAFRHAGEAAGQADIAAQHAARAQQASDEASRASDKARQITVIARKTDTERLASQQAQAMADADQALVVEEERKKRQDWEAGEQAKLEAETARLLAEARNPATPPEVVVANGRKVSARLVFTGGAWLKTAAEDALAGTEADVKEFVRIGLDNATEADDRASVSYIADSTTVPAMRQAAITALNGTWAQVKQFLDIGQHEIRADEYRIKVVQLLNGAGPRVKAAGNAALNNGSVQALRDFLKTGHAAAQEEDDRVTVTQMLSAGGPEVKAVAQAALSGPASYLRDFLQTKVHTAKQRDADTASHVANIDTYLAGAAMSAAEAKVSAAQALHAAAIARGAAQEAELWAQAARESADLAKQYADDAKESANQAQQSADQAAQSAKLAREAAAAAQAAAQAAAKSSAQAQASAEKARASADEAYAAAERARADAIAAGKSAAEAAKAAADAARIAAEKQRQEQEQKRQDDDQRQKDLETGVGTPGTGDDPDIDYSQFRSDNDILLAEGGQEMVDRYRGSESESRKDVLDFVISVGGQVFLDLIGWTDAKKCFTEGDIGSCIWTLINALGPLKLIKAALKLPEIGTAIFKIVRGLGAFRDGVAAARSFVERTRTLIRDIFGRIKNPCAPNSFTGDTRVLLADGTSKAIKDVTVGDRVMATNPQAEPSVTGARAVTRLITNFGKKNLVTISVAGGGSIDATDQHPFWVASQQRWRDAKDLGPGDKLLAPDGHYVTVTATHPWVQRVAVYNLTVAGLHTFYVVAGDVAVLVHNSGGAKACAIGQAGEAAIGRTKYSGPLIPINGRNRKPDFLDQWDLGEAKNVGYLYLSTQIKDYLQIARSRGLSFTIYVRTNGRTKLSQKLWDWINDNNVEIKEIIP